MKDTPKYGATFTLLYDDPEMPVEHPYLRPSYQHSFRAQRCRHGRHVTGARATSGAHGEAPYASFSGAGCERPQPVFAGAALGPPLGLERMMPSITSIAESAGTSTGEGRPPLLHVRPDGAPSLTTLQDVLGSGSTGDVHRSEANTNEELFRALEYYPSPDSRSGHLLVACSERESIILHGGLNADDVFHNDTWEYHVRTRRWKELKCRASSAPTAMTASPQREPSVGPSPTEMWSSTPSTAFHTPYSSVSPSREYLSSMPRWSSFVDLDDEMDLQEPNPENFPPAAHGQSGSIYHNADNEVCLFVMGGITAEETCSSTAFSLNLSSGIWTRLEMAVQFPMMWGSTVQTMQQPRRSSPRDDATTADGVDEDEEVVVMFGGMTVAGKVVADTWILHLSAPLTAAELSEDPDTYLDGIMYDVIEKERVRAYLDETGSLPPISVLGEDEDEIHLQHQNLIHDWKKHNRHTLQSWRREMLRSMVGKYWIEQITKTNDLLGRRRPSSSVFRRYFMFIFGGRDEAFFFNDFWVFNICTHTWVQVRLDVPRYWLAKFFNEPHNAEVGTYLSELLAEIRENKLMEAYRLFSPESRQAENTFDSLRTLREVLYASSSNSTARPRTGSCMALDPERELLFVYGGLGFNRRQYGTLGDLHVYNIREHTWYEVKHLKHRRWCAETDMWQSSILHVDPLADAMEHQCSLDPKPLDGTRTADGSTAALSVAEYVSHYGRRTRQQEGAAPSAAARVPKEEAYPPTPLAIRGGWWWTSPQVQPVQPTTGLEVDVEYFHLPVVTPYHRTMAALVADPIAPGRRFFLFGGRVSQFTYGDLLEMRVDLVGPQDLEYEDMQCKVCLPSKNPEFQPTSASIALQRWYRGGQLSEDSGNLGGVLRQSHRTQGAPHRAHERGTLKSAVVHWFQDLVCVRDTACMARVARVAPPAPNSTQCSGFGPHMSRLSSPAGSMASPSRVTWDGGASSANNPSATAEDIWRWRNNDSRVLPRSIMVRRAPIPASQWLAERTRKLVGASEYLRATLHHLLTSAGLAEDTGMNTLNDVRGFDDERPPLSVEGTPQSKRLSDACLKRLTRCVDVSGPAQRRNFSFCFGHAPFKDSNENRKINCMVHALMVLIFTAKKSDDFIFMDGEP